MHAPTGTVYLGHVPWDSSYRHVYEKGFGNPSAVIGNFMTMETNNYVFIREDSNIRVPYNADDLYGINYCVYRNSGKTFCCFVNTITYVSNNTTLLHLEEDIWQTWGGDLAWKTCFVAREHVSQDVLGQWRAPEPDMSLESVVLSEDRFNEVTYDTIVVATNAIPHLKNGGSIFAAHTESDFDGSDAVSGGDYGMIYSGARYYAFGPGQGEALCNFLDNLNKCGAAESVCALFMVPSGLITVGPDYSVGQVSGTISGTKQAPETLGGGYAPRNKKCLTYPYAYYVVTDNNGGEMELKHEDCATWGTHSYRIREGIDPTSCLYYEPDGYQGQGRDLAHLFPLGQNPQCTWVYQAYMNWAAQNSATIQTKTGINVLSAAAGALMLAGGAFLMSTGAGAPAGGMLGAAGLTTVEAAGLGLALSGAKTGISAAESGADLAATIDAQRKVPNYTKGTSSNNSLQGVGYNHGSYMFIGLQINSARRLDWFFDVYGYQIDQLRLPNIASRPSWNYLKTVGACMGGGIPADKLAAMNKCLDNGITFWHNEDVGNYGQNNRI